MVRTATGNNIQFPRVTALGTAGSVAEAGTIAESDGTLSALSLTPVKYATIIQVTEELAEDAAFDLGAMIADKCGAEVAVAHGAFAGTAVAAAASVGGTGSGTVSVNPTFTDLAKLKASVNQAYRRAPKAGWLMNDTTLGVVTGLVDTAGQPIFRPGDANTPDRLLGAPIYSAALIDLTDDTAGAILFGDLGQIYTVLVGGVRVEVSREFAPHKGRPQDVIECAFCGVRLRVPAAVRSPSAESQADAGGEFRFQFGRFKGMTFAQADAEPNGRRYLEVLRDTNEKLRGRIEEYLATFCS